MRPVSAEKPRLEYLDAIRGLAALSVVLNHYVHAFGNPTRFTTYFPLGIWWDGMAGVSMFFILSGFVLSLRHFDGSGTSGERELDYPRFVVARLFRIWVPYLAALLLCIVVYRFTAWHLETRPAARSWLTVQWTHPLRTANIVRDAFLVRSDGRDFIINPAWTLAIELIISMLVPAALIVAKRNSGWLVFVALLLFRSLHASVFILHFAAGILLAKHAPRQKASRGLLLAVLLLSIPLYNIRVVKRDPVLVTDAAWIISGIGALGILWAAIHSPLMQSILSHKWLGHLGCVSYGLYLLHAPVLICLTPRILWFCGQRNWHVNWLVGVVFTVAISLMLAEGFHRWIEVPSIAAGKRLGRFTSRMPGSAGAPIHGVQR